MQYLLPLALIGVVCSIFIVGALMRRETRAQVAQVRALTSTIESASDKLASRIGRIADRTERVEKALLELVQRADAAMSSHGIDVKSYRQAMRESAIDRMRELLAKGEEASAINVGRATAGIGLREAMDMVENLEREMNPAASRAQSLFL